MTSLHVVETDGTYVPHNAPLANETISPQRYYDGVPWTRSPEVSSDDGPTCNYGLATEDDVLRTGDGSPTGDFVPSVLRAYSQLIGHTCEVQTLDSPTVSMYSALV